MLFINKQQCVYSVYEEAQILLINMEQKDRECLLSTFVSVLGNLLIQYNTLVSQRMSILELFQQMSEVISKI